MKLGLPPAGLTVAQLSSKGAHRTRIASQALGISIGCLLGMFPLLFIDQDRRQLMGSFQDADKNKNGTISAEELSMALHRSGLMMCPEEVEWLVNQCGKTTHTSLTFNEFVELVHHWNEFNHQYQTIKLGQTDDKGPGHNKSNLATKIAFIK